MSSVLRNEAKNHSPTWALLKQMCLLIGFFSEKLLRHELLSLKHSQTAIMMYETIIVFVFEDQLTKLLILSDC